MNKWNKWKVNINVEVIGVILVCRGWAEPESFELRFGRKNYEHGDFLKRDERGDILKIKLEHGDILKKRQTWQYSYHKHHPILGYGYFIILWKYFGAKIVYILCVCVYFGVYVYVLVLKLCILVPNLNFIYSTQPFSDNLSKI